MSEKQYRTGILLTDVEKAIVDEEVVRRGLPWKRGFSPVVRMIIREWAEARKPCVNPKQEAQA